MSAYAIFNYTITNRSKIDELTKMSQPINEKYGAEVIVATIAKAIEGEVLPHMVIIKFKDYQSAIDCYYDEKHKEVTLLRQAITEGWLTIVPDVVTEMEEK